MSIVRALPKDSKLIHRLIQQARHVYINFGHEELSHFLKAGIAVLGIEDGVAWGFLCIEEEPRPDTLPAPMFSRAYLRSVVLARGASPGIDVNRLLNVAFPGTPRTLPAQLVYYATQSWLVRPLEMAGFQIVERVESWRLDYLNRRDLPEQSAPKSPFSSAEVVLRPFFPAEAARLARLDIETFNPLWHFGVEHLQELALNGRVQVAVRQSPATFRKELSHAPDHEDRMAGRLLGYSALTINSFGEAQIARLAVHPDMQGYGLGRYLLLDAVHYAQRCRASSLVLNTQTTNQAARALYHSVGFRSTGQITPVLTKIYR